MTMISRLLREPLLHFLVIGAGLFMLYGIVTPGTRNSDETIIISSARQANISAQFEATRSRPPTPEEMENLIRNFLHEEVLYRRAVALGLDKDDAVVRGRMRQKMEFFAESGARLLIPDDADLQAILDQNPEKFTRPGRVSFRQVFLGENPTRAAFDATITKLTAAGTATETFTELGQPTLLPAGMDSAKPQAISGVFGPEFAQALTAAIPETWVGPVASAYGQHIVLVVDQTPARIPDLAEIRDALFNEWRFAKTGELKDLQFQEELKKYTVIVETGEGE